MIQNQIAASVEPALYTLPMTTLPLALAVAEHQAK
jgi:hypothetical protein